MIKALRGTYDILPPDSYLWAGVEATARSTFLCAGFGEIRTPVFEQTDLFTRSIGEVTDIVEKEMYTFQDRKGRSLTLRPEGTACVVRACIEHKLLSQQGAMQKLFYIGPMFRYERPQAGRQRQFNQIGVEIFGSYSPLADADAIALMVRFFAAVGFDQLTVRLNSLGDDASLDAYRAALRATLAPHRDALCNECQRRYDKNILRVLDCKVPVCREICARDDMPTLAQHLSPAAAAHYADVKTALDTLGIPYEDVPSLVRGLDYYTHTIFEVTDASLGAQDALGGGGRYDGLVQAMGGPPTGAVGFAIGTERLLMALRAKNAPPDLPPPDIALIACDEEACRECFSYGYTLRDAGLRVHFPYDTLSIKAQMRAAGASGVPYVLLRGKDEREAGVFTCKNMKDGTHSQVREETLIEQMRVLLQQS